MQAGFFSKRHFQNSLSVISFTNFMVSYNHAQEQTDLAKTARCSHRFSWCYTFNKSKFVTDLAVVPPSTVPARIKEEISTLKFKLRYRPRMNFFITCIFLFDSPRGIHSTLDSAWNSTSACRQARQLLQLSKRQIRVCRSSPDAMMQVERAATAVSTTCQKLLEDRRWNCSSVLLAPQFTPDLTTGKYITSGTG